MSSILRQLAGRLREDRGVVLLEIMVCVSVWFGAVLIFVNMFVLLGTSMMVNTALTRAAQQTAASGCLHEAIVRDFQTRQQGMGASNFELAAATPLDGASGNYDFALASVVEAGDPKGRIVGDSALCTQRDGSAAITNGDFIWLRVKYTQRIAFLPGASLDVPMQRTTLVLSESLRGDPPAGR
jgi:hypothetical protein